MDIAVQDRIDGFLQFVAGSALFSLPKWAPALDQFISGAHAIASITGAVLGVFGLIKLLQNRSKQRRRRDRGESFRN